jgi:hypothetical protein
MSSRTINVEIIPSRGSIQCSCSCSCGYVCCCIVVKVKIFEANAMLSCSVIFVSS